MRLARFFVCRFAWLTKLGRLVLYFFCLLPGFAACMWWYFTDAALHRSVAYRAQPRRRNDCDVYVPDAARWPGARPVCVYVTGGAWIIGYKAWGLLFARWLRSRGWLVISLDYRNFPQAAVAEMLDDVSAGIAAGVGELAERYGGDVGRAVVVGQSAGAHLATLAALQARANGDEWLDRVRLYVGLSGVYDVSSAFAARLAELGLPRSLFVQLMAPEAADATDPADVEALLRARSPVHAVPALLSDVTTAAAFPPVCLYHGTEDRSAPPAQSAELHAAFVAAGVPSTHVRLLGRGHTEPVITELMRGDAASGTGALASGSEGGALDVAADSPWIVDLLIRMHEAVGMPCGTAPPAPARPTPRLVWDCAIRLAGRVSPF